LLQACLNGGRSRAEHRDVPLFPEEIARDARVVAAGAGALHVHPRAADGSETLDQPICDAVVRAVRDACPGIPIELTTAIWIEPDPVRRLERVAAWAVPSDFVSVNLSEAGVSSCAITGSRAGSASRPECGRSRTRGRRGSITARDSRRGR